MNFVTAYAIHAAQHSESGGEHVTQVVTRLTMTDAQVLDLARRLIFRLGKEAVQGILDSEFPTVLP